MAPRKVHPTLPRSAFSPVTPADPTRPAARRSTPISIVDSHIHLWGPELVPRLRWLNDDHPLSVAKSGGVWDHARFVQSTNGVGRTGATSGVQDFVFVQSEVKHDHNVAEGSQEAELSSALVEVDWLCQHASDKTPRVIALVPWAPLNQGPSAMASYTDRILALESYKALMKTTSYSAPRLSGFRYLQSNSPAGTMLQPEFIEALKWCGDNGYTFEIKIDVHRRGPERLQEAVDCITQVRESQDQSKQTKFVLCHMGQPDVSGNESVTMQQSTAYADYVDNLFALSLLSDVVVKFSGLLSETDVQMTTSAYNWFKSSRSTTETAQKVLGSLTVTSPSVDDNLVNKEKEGAITITTATTTTESVDSENLSSANQVKSGGGGGDTALAEWVREKDGAERWKQLKRSVKTTIEPIIESFGEHRIMFGSDFPVFRSNLGPFCVGDERIAYEFQYELYREVLVEMGLEDEGLDNIFALNAKKWYDGQSLD